MIGLIERCNLIRNLVGFVVTLNDKFALIRLLNYLDSILNLYSKFLRGNICDIEIFDAVL